MSTPLDHSFSTSNTPPAGGTPFGRIFGRRLSLGTRLPLMVILLLLLAFLISTFLSSQAARTALINTLKGELTTQSASEAELIRSYLIWTRGVAIDLAAAAEVTQYNQETIFSTIHNTLVRNEQIFGSTIAYEPYQFQPDIYYWSPYYSRTTSAELRFTQLGNPEYDYFRWDWYTLPKTRGVPVLSPPYYDEGGGEIWMVTWSAPFFDNTGKVKGVATADIAFSQVQEIVSQISVGQNGYAFLLDPQGIILGIGDKGGSYQVMVDSMMVASRSPQAEGWSDLTSSMMSGNSGFANAADVQGRPMFVAYTPVGLDTGWSLGLAFPQTELFQKALPLQTTLIVYASLVVAVFGVILFVFTRSITEPLRNLTSHARHFSARQLRLVDGQLAEPIQIHTQDELGELAEAVNHMATDLARTFGTLEEKVAERTRDLERRTFELETIAEVVRDITTVRDLDTLLNLAARLIQERFGYYHVGIFLVDERGEYAILRAASSVAAKTMLEQRHKLKVGETGIVGFVAHSGQARIAIDVGADAVHFHNPLLPETHSEIGLPLRSRNFTIGILDIQATESHAFNQDDIETLRLLTDQLAAAIENAQLVQRVEEALNELNILYQSQSQQAWQKVAQERGRMGLEYDGLQVKPFTHQFPAEVADQLESGKAVVWEEEGNGHRSGEVHSPSTLLVPLMAFKQVIGVIGLEQENPEHKWTPEEIAVAEAAANRAALTLENARLLEESQKRALKERTISDATTRISRALDMENILHTTAEELERVLQGSEVILQFHTDGDKTRSQ